MTLEEKLGLIEDCLEVQEGSLKPELLLADIAEYDSISKLSLIVMLKDEFDQNMTSDIMKSFETVGDILKLME